MTYPQINVQTCPETPVDKTAKLWWVMTDSNRRPSRCKRAARNHIQLKNIDSGPRLPPTSLHCNTIAYPSFCASLPINDLRPKVQRFVSCGGYAMPVWG